MLAARLPGRHPHPHRLSLPGVELKPSGRLGPSSWEEVDEPSGCAGRGQDEKQIFTEDVERKPEGQAASSWARSSKENLTVHLCAGPASLGGLARATGGGPALRSRAMGSPGGGLSCWGAQTGSRAPGSVAAVPRLQGERSVVAAHTGLGAVWHAGPSWTWDWEAL